VVRLDVEIAKVPQHPGELPHAALAGIGREPKGGPEDCEGRPKPPAGHAHLVQVFGIRTTPDSRFPSENPPELLADGLRGSLTEGQTR